MCPIPFTGAEYASVHARISDLFCDALAHNYHGKRVRSLLKTIAEGGLYVFFNLYLTYSNMFIRARDPTRRVKKEHNLRIFLD